MNHAAPADVLSRFVFEGLAIRGARVRLDETAQAILGTHRYPESVARVLVELAGAATLLAGSLGFDGRLSLQLVGAGPVRLMVVECNPGLALRAMAQFDAAGVAALPPQATVDVLVGDPAQARLAITLDPREGGPVYQGIVALESRSVAATIEHYLRTSEQVASRLVLKLRGSLVFGILLQRMPASGPDDDLAWSHATAALSDASADSVVAAAQADAGLAALFADHDLRVFTPATPRFLCTCSRARVAGALRIAGRDEIEAALADDGVVEVTCEFCGCRYAFDPDQARALFAPASGDGAASTRH